MRSPSLSAPTLPWPPLPKPQAPSTPALRRNIHPVTSHALTMRLARTASSKILSFFVPASFSPSLDTATSFVSVIIHSSGSLSSSATLRTSLTRHATRRYLVMSQTTPAGTDAGGKTFASTLFLALSPMPMLKQNVMRVLQMTSDELASLEPVIAGAWNDWDRKGRPDQDGSPLDPVPPSQEAGGMTFATTLFLALSSTPLLKQHVFRNLGMTDADLESLEPIIAKAWNKWDYQRLLKEAMARGGQLFASTALLSLSDAPDAKQALLRELQMTDQEFVNLEPLIATAWSTWDRKSRPRWADKPDAAQASGGHVFASQIFSSLSSSPMLKQHLMDTLSMTEAEFTDSESTIAHAWNLWDAQRRLRQAH